MIVLQATIGRLYPSAAQERQMARIGGQCRALWNHWLAVNRDRYAVEGKFAFYAEMSAALPALRREDRYAGLPHRCAQMTVQKLDRALRDCAKRATVRKGFPKFKKRDDRRDAFQFVGREVGIEADRIKLPALGWLRVHGMRIAEGARLIQATVRQDRGGWAVAVQFEGAAPIYPEPIAPTIGIDVGLTSLLALSNGRKIEPPRFACRQSQRLRRLERQKARRRRDSVNRRRTVARLNRLHAHLAAQRKDFSHKLSRELIDEHAGIAVETLRLKGLMRTRLAKSFADAGFAELRRQLAYKTAWARRDFCEMPTFQRSTGVCPDCGLVGLKLPLSVRAWQCAGCGAMHDRDVAAAQVILRCAVPRVNAGTGGEGREKRGAAVRGGVRARARASHGGSPANVAEARATELVS